MSSRAACPTPAVLRQRLHNSHRRHLPVVRVENDSIYVEEDSMYLEDDEDVEHDDAYQHEDPVLGGAISLMIWSSEQASERMQAGSLHESIVSFWCEVCAAVNSIRRPIAFQGASDRHWSFAEDIVPRISHSNSNESHDYLTKLCLSQASTAALTTFAALLVQHTKCIG